MSGRKTNMFIIKRTPVLITELIHSFPKMNEMQIYNALCEIRTSAERDERISATYRKALSKKRGRIKNKDDTSGE